MTNLVLPLLRLKMTLLGNLFRRSPMQVVGLVLGLVYGATITVLVVVALIALRFAPPAVAEPAVVITGSVTVLGFLVVPLLLGVDDALDPHRFALFGIERDRLALGLAAAALLGIPSLVMILVTAATVVTWSRSVPAVLIAVLAAATAVATCVLLSRIGAAAAGLLLATRRSRETVGGIAIVGFVLVGPLVVLLANLPAIGISPGSVLLAARVLGWTPLGAAWAAPASVARGDARGVLQLLVAVAVVGLLWLAWRALVAATLVTPVRQGRMQVIGGLGWFGRLPARPGWAIAARSLTYWARDGRYRVSLALVPILPLVMLVPLTIVGVPGRLLALLPIPVVALFLGFAGHNDVAYDNTAIWLHLVSGIRGRADRLGRAFPLLAVGVPVIVVGSLVCATLYGRLLAALPIAGVSLCLLLSGIGFSFYSSARFPYPVPRPGDSPFQQPTASGGFTAAVQSVTFFAQFVIAAPAVGLAVLGLLQTPVPWWPLSFAVGLLVGLLVFAVGLALGSRTFERREPEMLGAALRA